MALRNIIRIDEDKCDGCGLCVTACAEGAIRIIDGKARLISETYCDGLGACLSDCPRGAITIEQRDARPYSEAAVQLHLANRNALRPDTPQQPFAGCPGSRMQDAQTLRFHFGVDKRRTSRIPTFPLAGATNAGSPHAPFLKGADLVICADCVPFAVPDFHNRYLTNRSVVVGCPKLDNLSLYHEKIERILTTAEPSRVTVLIMEVPCCGGLAHAVAMARNELAPNLPMEIHTIGIKGDIEKQILPVPTDEEPSERRP